MIAYRGEAKDVLFDDLTARAATLKHRDLLLPL